MKPLLILAMAGLLLPGFSFADTSPLTKATELALKIEGDDDQRAAQLHRIAEAKLSAGDIRSAIAMVDSLTGHRRGVLAARCAAALVRSGSPDERITKLAKVAENEHERATARQREQIALQLIVLHQMKGERDDDQERMKRIRHSLMDDESRLADELLTAAARVSSGTPMDIDNYSSRIKGVCKGNPFPPAVQAARLMLGDRVDAASAKASSAIAAAGAVPHADFLLELTRRLIEAKDTDAAETMLQKALNDLRMMPDSLEQKPALHALLARVLRTAGHAAQAKKAVEAGERIARKQNPMESPGALAPISIAWHEQGDQERSAKIMDEVFRDASANPNPRMRLISGIEICLAHSEAGVPLQADTVDRLGGLMSNTAQGTTP